MRRLELLIQEVRDATDSNDTRSYSIYELMRYFNDAQRTIQKIAKSNGNKEDLFTKLHLTQISSGTYDYSLPDDIYSLAAIQAVGIKLDSRNTFRPLDKITPAEAFTFSGYYFQNNRLWLSFDPSEGSLGKLAMVYMYKLPIMSLRISSIDSIASNVITSTLLVTDTGFNSRYDKYSIVSPIGVIKASNLLLESHLAGVFTFDTDLDGIVEAGDFIVCGEYGSSHSELPDSCENFLLAYVQRRIKSKLTSKSKSDEDYFTAEERSDIEEIFSSISNDIVRPIWSDTDYLI